MRRLDDLRHLNATRRVHKHKVTCAQIKHTLRVKVVNFAHGLKLYTNHNRHKGIPRDSSQNDKLAYITPDGASAAAARPAQAAR